MQTLVLVASLLVAAPFQDTQGRFTVDLPAGWVFAPQPGDTGGAYFRKNLEGMIANATVRVMNFSGPVPLNQFAARIAAASDQEPGFRLLLSEPTTVAGAPALKRRFVVAINGDKQWTKMVEQRVLLRGAVGYVVHVETLADAYGTFEADFNKIFSSFRPGSPEREIVHEIQQERVGRARVRKADLRLLAGHWEGGGHALHLTPAGTVTLDGMGGTYRVDHGVLVLTLASDQRIYEFSLSGDTLSLSGGNFGDGQAFRRFKGTNPAGGDD